MKIRKLTAAAAILALLASNAVYAGGWQSSRGGWWYDLGGGNYPAGGWLWIDGNGDRIEECYYFKPDGWLLTEATTPDGFTVDGNGAWTVNGVVQRRAVSGGSNGSALSAASERAELLRLVNQERSRAGLQPLSDNSALDRVAEQRAQELGTLFSHTRPNGQEWSSLYAPMGITEYHAVGENIASGQKSAESVMDSWMHSEGHRRNILDPKYSSIGIGYSVQGGQSYWVQNFLG